MFQAKICRKKFLTLDRPNYVSPVDVFSNLFSSSTSVEIKPNTSNSQLFLESTCKSYTDENKNDDAIE